MLGRRDLEFTDLADKGKLLEPPVLALRVRLGLLVIGEAERYDDDVVFQRVVGAMIEMKKAAGDYYPARFIVASALSSQQLQ
eukprot:4797947-Pleurochrysis_carterae.AAC.2